MIQLVRRKLLQCVLVSVFVAPVAIADTPATQPEGGRPSFPSNEDERGQITGWTDQFLPNLSKLMRTAMNNHATFRLNRLKFAATTHWKAYQRVQNNPSLLESFKKDLRLENEIFGYVGDYDSASPDQRPTIAAEIYDKTRQAVNQFLDDRAQRIDRLRAQLDAEQKSLDADRAHVDMLVDQRLKHFSIDVPTTNPAATTEASVGEGSQ